MKLIAHEQVQHRSVTHTFDDASWRGLLFVGLGFCFLALCIVLIKRDDLAGIAAIFPLLLGLIFLYWTWVRRKNNNQSWFMKVTPDGLYLNMDYCDGYPVREVSGTVLFVPQPWVARLIPVREVLVLPHRFGITRHHFSCLDVVCHYALPQPVVEAISKRESACKNAGKSGPYPLRRVGQQRLRLNWGWVQPGAQETITQLTEQYGHTKECMIVFPDWNSLSDVQKEAFLDELWRMGLLAACITLGREYYRRSSKEVRQLLESRNAPPSSTEA